jgi:hypothetical protein
MEHNILFILDMDFWVKINILMKPAAFIFKADMKTKQAHSLKTLELSNMVGGVIALKTIT